MVASIKFDFLLPADGSEKVLCNGKSHCEIDIHLDQNQSKSLSQCSIISFLTLTPINLKRSKIIQKHFESVQNDQHSNKMIVWFFKAVVDF